MKNKIPNLTLDSKADISNENWVSPLKNNLLRISKIKNEDRRDIINNNEDHLNKKETKNYNENQLNIKPFTLSEDEDEIEDGHKKDMNNNKNSSQKQIIIINKELYQKMKVTLTRWRRPDWIVEGNEINLKNIR